MRTGRAANLGRTGWLLHRIIASYWSLPICGVIAALPALFGLLSLDRGGLTQTLLDYGLNPVETADTAKDLMATATAINAAFITLYFSLTLLVLTVASSNLGVRLVDRWLEKLLARVSITFFSFTLVFSFGAMAAIDGQAQLDQIPIATVGLVMFMQVANVGLLTIALHDLGRTIFVDRAIHTLGRDASVGLVSVHSGEEFAGQWAAEITAPREGYIEGNDLEGLSRRLASHEGRVRICTAPGHHVLKGETMLLLERPVANADRVLDHLPIGDYRSDGQGTVFRIRLLVEIAARALSPAINDFYTALSAGDRLVAVMAGQQGSWVDAADVPVWTGDNRFELPGQDFRGLFENPLSAFRQAACDYPSVSIRMIDNYSRFASLCQRNGASAELIMFLEKISRELSDHALSATSFEKDRDDIEAAIARAFPLSQRI